MRTRVWLALALRGENLDRLYIRAAFNEDPSGKVNTSGVPFVIGNERVISLDVEVPGTLFHAVDTGITVEVLAPEYKSKGQRMAASVQEIAQIGN